PKTLKKFEIEELEKAIINAVEEVNKILKPYIGGKSNKKQKEKWVFHSDFQIISIIGKVFHSIYTLQEEEGKIRIRQNRRWKTIKKNLEKNLPMYYLYDIIRGYWSGTGDKKAKERAFSSTYEESISKEAWEAVLDEWHKNEKSKRETRRKTINKVAVLFLNYIYTHLISENQSRAKDFEVDHVVPFARLQKVAQEVGGLPISAIGNLALINKDLNLKKRDKTIYEMSLKDNETKWLEKWLFIDKKMLSFLKRKGSEVEKGFNRYLDKRFERMKEKFFELNEIV
ncbi:MAG: hypothetical protein GXO48_01085, partial [Chlorobi bacterium]|nr:hypothetical protein [Chlorobiota bacterium]